MLEFTILATDGLWDVVEDQARKREAVFGKHNIGMRSALKYTT